MKIRLVFLLLAAVAAPALAGLGGPATTVVEGQSGARISRLAAVSSAYSVNEILTEDGTRVREYVDGAGVTFGVAWEGPYMPDLRSLFGAYFPAFQEEAKARKPGQGALNIARPDLVIQSGGHMRAFRGRAYLPTLLPSGVSPEVIQ